MIRYTLMYIQYAEIALTLFLIHIFLIFRPFTLSKMDIHIKMYNIVNKYIRKTFDITLQLSKMYQYPQGTSFGQMLMIWGLINN